MIRTVKLGITAAAALWMILQSAGLSFANHESSAQPPLWTPLDEVESMATMDVPGGMVTVHLGKSPVSIAIEDDGPGIPDAERAHVTERFYRLSSSPAGGSGLGLNIVKEFVELHRGTVVVLDAPGGGGKVPINPAYVEEVTDDEVVFRNFEGKTFRYPLKSTPVPAKAPGTVVPAEIHL